MPDIRKSDFNPWAALALLCAAQFMVVLDASIVNVALPSIGEDLGISQENLSWIVNAYVLFFGGFLLLGGRLADLLGRRAVFVAGLALFSAASLAGGFATNETQLIIARALQGLGGALFSPAALSIITAIFKEGADRNKALGAWGAVAGSGGAAGVLLGGVLTDFAGWEWVLWVNVPIGLLAIFLSFRLVPESRMTQTKRHFDIPGAISVTAGLCILVYALVDAESAGWGSTQTILLLIVAVALLSAFVGVERRSPSPLVPGRLVQLATVRGSNIVALLVGASLFSMFFFVSLYMQQVLGFSPLETGLAYLPLAVTIILSAGIASQLVTKMGFKPILMVGLGFVMVGLAWFSQVSVGGSYVSDVLGPSLLAAVGLGFSFVPVTIGAVTGITNDDAGIASGLINASQQVGGALGLAVLATIANGKTDDVMAAAGGDPAALPGALTDGFQLAFIVGAGFAALGLVLAYLLIDSRDSQKFVEEGGEGVPVAA
jgi:EmrB/QacA subfamily drug resistance transporter